MAGTNLDELPGLELVLDVVAVDLDDADRHVPPPELGDLLGGDRGPRPGVLDPLHVHEERPVALDVRALGVHGFRYSILLHFRPHGRGISEAARADRLRRPSHTLWPVGDGVLAVARTASLVGILPGGGVFGGGGGRVERAKLKTVFEQLRDANWRTIGKELAAYALARVRTYRWRTGNRRDLAEGQQAVDLAAEAIRRLMDGTRRWDPNEVALVPFLRGVVDSLVSHLADSADNARQVRIPDGEDGEELGDRFEFDAARNDHHGLLPDRPPDPETVLAAHRREFADKRLDQLLDEVKDNADLVAVVDALMRVDEPKPAAIAEHLGLEVSEVNNRLKRLRRTADRLTGTHGGAASDKQTDER